MKRRIISIVVVVMAGAAVCAMLYVSGARQRSTALATRGNKTAPAIHAREARPPTLEFVEPLVYDFGKMPQMRTDSHIWKVKNVGDSDLILWQEPFTKSCKIANIPYNPAAGTEQPKTRIKPNETTQIEVQWQTRRFVNNFSTGCIVGTNDPQRPHFWVTVQGMVYPEG
jgi:Protein of unknown function (DUF1573)